MNEIDLQPFCSTEFARPYLHRPFSVGEFTYATNGHILVRVPLLSGVEPPSESVDVGRVFEMMGSDRNFIPLPSLETIPADIGPCAECDGRGTLHNCPDCEHDCPACSCKGEKKMSVRLLGKAVFNAKYLLMIGRLPGPIEVSFSDGVNPTFFLFDGGHVALMPMLLDAPDIEIVE